MSCPDPHGTNDSYEWGTSVPARDGKLFTDFLPRGANFQNGYVYQYVPSFDGYVRAVRTGTCP